MGLWNTRRITAKEYEEFLKLVTKLEQKLEKLETAFENLKTNQNSLRGLVNRKFGTKAEEEDESESNKYKDFLPN